ncbi:HNH endonuclease signature motif containing protein [Agrococcus sp. ARC_14]|uniref:HNH endonuclease n=1 Tax=Agrococcus sp. ARC_14 TaxID=2919927 RepID=UPI001F05F642|nr:HNH endonuclease signature motif containing protein [Agrococcus sp. ARC_14]MCH1884068.1 HNH endonuclease [Agrococcus sp. ARC_14]
MTRVEQAATAVAAVRAMFADAASLATVADHEIAMLLSQTAELARLVQAQQVRLAGVVDARSDGSPETDLCRKLGKRSAKEAVASAFGIRAREASELLSMARATTARISVSGGDIPKRYPLVADGLDAGELSLAQARAIVTTLETGAANADLELLAWAEGCLVEAATDPEGPLAPELLVEQARAYVAVLDPDGVLPASERQRAMRSLRHWQQPDGMWRTLMISPPEEGSALKALLDAHTAPRVQVRFRDDQPAAPTAGNPMVPVDDRSLEQQRHDVMMGIVRAQAASGKAPLAGGEVPRLVFTVQQDAYEAYRRGLDHPDRTLTIEHTRNPVPIETIDRLLCDAIVQRALVDAGGEVLELGRTERLFSRAQRRALAAQYGSCAGCAAPVAWTEAHHVWWWQRGGDTDVRNGILLCSHCHHEVHAGRLVVVGTPGCWRVVPQLRPADARARAARKRPAGRVPGIGQIARIALERGASAAGMRGAIGVDADLEPIPWVDSRDDVLAAGAAANLAVKIPASSRPPSVRRPGLMTRSLEARLHRRLRASVRSGTQGFAVDHRPAPRIVMRA